MTTNYDIMPLVLEERMLQEAWDGNSTQYDEQKIPNNGPYFRTYEIWLIVIFSVVSCTSPEYPPS